MDGLNQQGGPMETKVIEWTPGEWWVVRITGKDGSYTPLAGPFKSQKKADTALETVLSTA